MTVFIKEPTKDELTKKGFTNRIKIAEGQTRDSLTEYGFTNFNKPVLYYMEMIDKNTSFNLRINKETLEITDIDILDENWLQPYDYQSIISKGIRDGKARNTYNKVNNILTKLQSDGVIIGFEKGMYI